jgi:RNA polymerase sigma-70 factor (ECF subfamily)
VGNHEDALDVAQEAFVRVYRSLHTFDPERRFGTWLYRIVANLAIDCLRRRRACRVQPGLGELAETAGAEDETWLDTEVRRDEVEEVYRCLDRLPDKYREIIILRDIENIPAREIAQNTGLTHATVRWRLHQGRKLFKEVWERLVLRRERIMKELT